VQLPVFKINAFTSRFDGGNPAGVCPLSEWLPVPTMQAIAAENGYSETAFFVARGDGAYDLRWFTPTREIELCGHATLASAFALKNLLGVERRTYVFHTLSGELRVDVQGDKLVLDMPVGVVEPVATIPDAVARGIGIVPQALFTGRFYLALLASADEVKTLKPDFKTLQTIDRPGIIVTARGVGEVDYVSRWFGGPGIGIDEDPATGSAHCLLAPFWAARLSKTVFTARQLSARGGEFDCVLAGNRVKVGGQAVVYFSGTLNI
jgi:PhzF family phenazine biosynthesis protein